MGQTVQDWTFFGHCRLFSPPGTVMLNGQRESLPVMTGDLVVRRASSSFLLIQTFGAQLLWYLHGPLALITLQPGFANKVNLPNHFVYRIILKFYLHVFETSYL